MHIHPCEKHTHIPTHAHAHACTQQLVGTLQGQYAQSQQQGLLPAQLTAVQNQHQAQLVQLMQQHMNQHHQIQLNYQTPIQPATAANKGRATKPGPASKQTAAQRRASLVAASRPPPAQVCPAPPPPPPASFSFPAC